MVRIKWLINRLRVMGGNEVIFRAARASQQVVEEIKLKQGWVPKPHCNVTPRSLLFPDISVFKEDWEASFTLDEKTLEHLLSGKVEIFGSHQVTLPSNYNWRLDPTTNISAPLTYGKKLNYRDENKVGNIKVTWELARHHHLVPLAVAYAITGDNHYLKSITFQIESWIENNPCGYGIHWSSSLEAALRLISWSLVHSLVATRNGRNGLFSVISDSRALGHSIFQQSHFIRYFLSRYSSANNHLIGELSGLWTACHVFNLGPKGDEWRNYAKMELEREFKKQTYDDGVNKEQALYYHLWVLEYMLFCITVGYRLDDPFSENLVELVTLMAQFITDLTPAGGKAPQIGDSDDGFVTRFSASWPHDAYWDVLTAQQAVYDTGTATQTEKAFWYSQIANKQSVNTLEHHDAIYRTSIPKVYEKGGYAILGDDIAKIIFVAGPLGYTTTAAHGHADALSICLAVNDHWWLTDPGTYVYHTDQKWRDYFKGTSAHNTLRIDKQNQSTIGGPFLWLKHARGFFTNKLTEKEGIQSISGSHDGYKSLNVSHERLISYDSSRKILEITDIVKGSTEHDIEINFHFSPELSITNNAPGKFIVTKFGSSVSLSVSVDHTLQWQIFKGSLNPIAGWYSAKLGSKEPSGTLRGTTNRPLPLKIITNIAILSH